MSTIVVRNSFCARSSAFSRSLSSAKAAAAATLSTSSGSSRERLVVEQARRPGAPSCSTTVIAAVGTCERSSVRPSRVDPASLALEPEREPERGVAERLRERGAEGPPALELDHQPGDRAAGEPAPQDPEQEGERDSREEEEEDRADHAVHARRERPDRVAHQQQDERRTACRVHGQQEAAGRGRRRAPAADEDHARVCDQADRVDRRNKAESVPSRASRSTRNALDGAFRAARLRAREEQREREYDEDEHDRQPDEPAAERIQAAGRESRDERR